jgi:hypothetical protein
MRWLFNRVFLGIIFLIVLLTSASLAQAPIIVDLTMSLFRGIITGAGEAVGKTIVEGAIGEPSQPTAPGVGEAPHPDPGHAVTVPFEPPPPPDGLRWKMRNESGGNIVMQFYSVDRHGHWPSGNRAYLLPNGQMTVIRLHCEPGEKVCYGGGAPSRYWGTGLSAGFPLRHPCAHCCRRCGSEGQITFR